MARRQARMPVQQRKYFIYDTGVQRYLGGFPVKVDGEGHRFVMLSSEQANYWSRTGVLGLKRLHELEGEERRQVHQISGGRIPMTAEDFERGRVREDQVRTMGAYGLPGKIVKVATKRNAVQDPATHIDNVIRKGGMVTEAAITDEQRRHARINNTQVAMQFSEGMTRKELATTRHPNSKG